MGCVGSGNWYRFDKKTTTEECHSVDVRYLHREGLLKPGHWFSLPNLEYLDEYAGTHFGQQGLRHEASPKASSRIHRLLV
jgi:hypothetical protein